MQRQGTSCSHGAAVRKRRGASQSGARLPQGLLPLRSLRLGDAIGLSPFSPSRRKRARRGQILSICEELPTTNFLPSIPTWANVGRREKGPPRRQISTHISTIFVPGKTFSGKLAWGIAPRHHASKIFGGPRRAARRITSIALHLRTLDLRHIQQYAKSNLFFSFLIGKAIIFARFS